MNVLLATDGSPYAKEAAKYLCGMQIADQLKVTILTVSYDPESTTKGRPQHWHQEWRENEKSAVDAHFDELDEILADKFAHLTRLHRTGNSVDTILRTAKSIDADLIVMGAVGHSLISRMLLGSVSDEVATRAECSVLVIRPHNDQGAQDQVAQEGPYRITVAYDNSKPSNHAVDELLGLRWKDELHLDVVSVGVQFDHLVGDGIYLPDLANEQQTFDAIRKDLEKVTERVAQKIPLAESRLVKGAHVGDTIVEYAESSGSDLIVIGDAGHGFFHDVLLGSTTKYVLRHAPCSVWISRHHQQLDRSSAESAEAATLRSTKDKELSDV